MAVLDAYPRRWRLRYGVEMRAMVEAMPVTWRQVADLAVGGVREWFSPRAVGWPARSAAEAVQWRRAALFTLVALSLEIAVHALVHRDRALIDPALLEPALVVLLATSILRVCLGRLHGWARRRSPKGWIGRQRWLGPARTPEVLFWVGGVLFWLVYEHARPLPSYARDPALLVVMGHVQSIFWFHVVFTLSDRSRRLWKVELSHMKREGAALQAELNKLPARFD